MNGIFHHCCCLMNLIGRSRFGGQDAQLPRTQRAGALSNGGEPHGTVRKHVSGSAPALPSTQPMPYALRDAREAAPTLESALTIFVVKSQCLAACVCDDDVAKVPRATCPFRE